MVICVLSRLGSGYVPWPFPLCRIVGARRGGLLSCDRTWSPGLMLGRNILQNHLQFSGSFVPAQENIFNCSFCGEFWGSCLFLGLSVTQIEGIEFHNRAGVKYKIKCIWLGRA